MNENDIARIEVGSEAWAELKWALENPQLYKLAIYVGPDGFKVKGNELTWSPPLATDIAPTI